MALHFSDKEFSKRKLNILNSMKVAKTGISKLKNKYTNEYNEFELKII